MKIETDVLKRTHLLKLWNRRYQQAAPKLILSTAKSRPKCSKFKQKKMKAQHPIGAEIWSSDKVDLVGYDSTLRSPRLLDQTSPNLFRLTQEESR